MLLFCNIDVHRIHELEMCIDPLLGGYLNFSGLHGLLDTTWGYGCFLSVWLVLCFVWPYIFLVVMRALLQLRAQGFFFVPKHFFAWSSICKWFAEMLQSTTFRCKRISTRKWIKIDTPKEWINQNGFDVKKKIMHQPGIEPGSVPWQGTILPLDHWCQM